IHICFVSCLPHIHPLLTKYTSQTSLLFNTISGESANAVPHYQKLCNRDSHIWGIRIGQHSRSAMAEPRPGQTTFLIIVSPLPGKYELYKTELALAVLAQGSTGTVGAPPTFRQAANAPQAPQSLCQGHAGI